MSAEMPPSTQLLLTSEVGNVFRLAYRLTGDVHDAEDLVQDACERALRNAPGFASGPDCRRWLLRVIYNRFVDTRRRSARSPVVALASGQPEAIAERSDPIDAADEAEAEDALICAWARLETPQQLLLVLRAEGYDLDEISAITNIDKPGLSSRLYRARASLARHLAETRSAQTRSVGTEKRR